MAIAKHIIPGEKFHRLTVLHEAPRLPGNHNRRAAARCDCGVVKDYFISLIRNGTTKSCGCWRRECDKLHQKYDGQSQSADIVPGSRYGFLTVIAKAKSTKKYEICVTAKCDCGVVKDFRFYKLKSGKTQSCGCLQKNKARARRTHGHTSGPDRSRAYKIWQNMIQRCTNPGNDRYLDYGGRGIEVCGRWRKFENFLTDMGDPPSKLTLDRFPDVDGNYEPSNCRWATLVEQANNTRRNHVIEFNGRSMTLAQWSAEIGVPYHTLKSRINRRRWTIERALTEPVMKS